MDGAHPLTAGLAALARLDTSALSSHAALSRIAEFGAVTLPAADGVGLSLAEHQPNEPVATSGAFAGQVIALERAVGEGPGLTTFADPHAVRSGSLGADHRWLRFGPRAVRISAHSAMALPLLAGSELTGVLEFYARAHDAFDDDHARGAQQFAEHAAVVVRHVAALSAARRLVAQLQSALTSRATIDHSIGILMSRTGCDSDEAFTRLRAISQRENHKVADVARTLVDDAVRRARLRHDESPALS